MSVQREEDIIAEQHRNQWGTSPAFAAMKHHASGGTKYDMNKPRMDLVDPYALEQLAKVLTFGAGKYAPHNWRGGIAYSRLIAAAMRHLNAFNAGEDNDPESGLPHIAHLLCCGMFILGLSKTGADHDDRYKPSSKEK